jgi:hypothetical protein
MYSEQDLGEEVWEGAWRNVKELGKGVGLGGRGSVDMGWV